MAITNEQLIRGIEKRYPVKLEFEFYDGYGLYCFIHPADRDASIKVNVWDSGEVVSGRARRMYLRMFLEDAIYQYMDSEGVI